MFQLIAVLQRLFRPRTRTCPSGTRGRFHGPAEGRRRNSSISVPASVYPSSRTRLPDLIPLSPPAQDFLAQELTATDRVLLDGEAQPLAEARGLLQPGPFQLAQARRGRLLGGSHPCVQARSLRRGAAARSRSRRVRRRSPGRARTAPRPRTPAHAEGHLGRGGGLLDQRSLPDSQSPRRTAAHVQDHFRRSDPPSGPPSSGHLGPRVLQPVARAPVVRETRDGREGHGQPRALQRFRRTGRVEREPRHPGTFAPDHNHGFVRGDLRDLTGLEHFAPFVHRHTARGRPHFQVLPTSVVKPRRRLFIVTTLKSSTRTRSA